MVHSIELTFDPNTDAAVRQLWDDLTDTGIRSQAAVKSPSNRPHVTLTVAERLNGSAEDVRVALQPAVERLPLPCRVGALMVFGGRTFTLVRLLVPSVDLLALHTEIHRLMMPQLASGVLPHAIPGEWTPHVTLARRLTAEQLAVALQVPGLGAEIAASATTLRHWDSDNRVEQAL